MNACENCGEPVDMSYPDDPEIMAVLMCSVDCADEVRPLPAGYMVQIAETEGV